MQVSGALVVSDPLLAARVQQVIQHPVANERPDLLHFSPKDASQTIVAAGAGLFGGGGPGGPTLLLIGLSALLLMAVVSVVLLRRSPRLCAVVVISCLAMVAPVGAAAGGAFATHPATSSHAPSAVDVVRNPIPDNALRARAQAAPRLSRSWTALVAIEQAIARDHAQLVESENAISSYNTLLTNAQSTPPAAPGPATAAATLPPSLLDLQAPVLAAPTATSPDATATQPGLIRPNLVSVVTVQLGTLVSQHEALTSQYQQDLQREYDFFVAAAQSTQTQSEVAQAATLAEPEAATAIAYDINLVYTQLSQEAAIQQAEAAAAANNPRIAPAPFVPSGRISFRAPVGGSVNQGFGPTDFSLEPPLRYNGVFYPHFHTGLDIGNALGTPIGASADGVVILATSSLNGAGQLTGYGNYVVIDHGGGFLSLYGHMEKLLVTTGQVVKQGEVIGLLGSTGWSTGPHLHFEIRSNGVFVDPAPYIAAQIRR